MCGKGMAGVYRAMGCRERPLKLPSHMLCQAWGWAAGAMRLCISITTHRKPLSTSPIEVGRSNYQFSELVVGGWSCTMLVPPPFAFGR